MDIIGSLVGGVLRLLALTSFIWAIGGALFAFVMTWNYLRSRTERITLGLGEGERLLVRAPLRN